MGRAWDDPPRFLTRDELPQFLDAPIPDEKLSLSVTKGDTRFGFRVLTVGGVSRNWAHTFDEVCRCGCGTRVVVEFEEVDGG